MSRKYITVTRGSEFDYVHKNKAKIESLDYYFKNNFIDVENIHNIEFEEEKDRDWIDWDCVADVSETGEHYKKYKAKRSPYAGSEYTPSRCKKCKRPYSRTLNGTNRFLPYQTYVRIPLKDGNCGKCYA